MVLAPRCWRQVREKQNFSRATVARKPGHRGERGVNRNPSRRESRIASAEPVCSCAFSVFLGTRDRGCSAHPAFPAPSRCFRGRRSHAKSGRIAPRQCGCMSSRSLTVESETRCFVRRGHQTPVIACDKREAFAQGSIRDEAIHSAACCPMDCFASLAMTAERPSLIALGRRSQ